MRQRKNVDERDVDTTEINVGRMYYRGYIHRDYLAHMLRWNHVRQFTRRPRNPNMRLLDVGCGASVPLVMTLFSERIVHKDMQTKAPGTGVHVCIDYGKIDAAQILHNSTKNGTYNMALYPNTDFIDWSPSVQPTNAADLNKRIKIPEKYDVIVCFEVLEHVRPLHAFKMLCKMADCLDEEGVAFLSTPCFDPRVGAAANHINEMTHSAFGAMIKAAGLRIEMVWGTFASQKDYKKFMPPAHKQVFDELSKYYDTEILSCFFAPLYPAQSRNCIWRCRKATAHDIPPESFTDSSNSSCPTWSEEAEQMKRMVVARRTSEFMGSTMPKIPGRARKSKSGK